MRRRWILAAPIALAATVGAVLPAVIDRGGGGEEAGGAKAGGPDGPLAGRAATPRVDPIDSNIRAADYVGPGRCGECHADKYASWSGNLHRSMNRLVGDGPRVVRGDFGGRRVGWATGEARFERRGADYLVSLRSVRGALRRFRVTRTIGTRYLQEYVGVQEVGPEPAGDPIYATELRLPLGWWVRGGGWFRQPYYDSWYGPEVGADGRLAVDPFEVDRSPWASRCAWCHNTYPFELRAERAAEVRLGEGLEQYVELRRTATAGGSTSAAAAALVAQNLLPVDRLVTVGISCESCHLGGRAHAEAGRPIHFDPRSPDLAPRAGAPDLSAGRRSALVVNSICAQCHSTPTPTYPDGAAARNSSEALDMAGGACMSRIRCTDCHDPHQLGPGARAPDQARHLAACTGCHAPLASPAAARAHARHDPSVASCLDCHMPRIVQGLSDAVRSHRIGSPARAALAAGGPNACNLCHLDRSIAWTVAQLRAGWGAVIEVTPSWEAAYGGIDRPVGEAWLAGADRNLRDIAAAAWARSPLGPRALAALLERLDDPVAYDRMRILFAVEEILGRRLSRREYDPTAPPDRRAAQAAHLRARPPR